MRKLKQSVIFSVALAFVFGAFAVFDTNAQVVNDILTRMHNHKESLQSLKANVAMEKTDTTLNISDVTKGKTFYLPGKGREPYVRVNWTDPLEETLLVKNGKYVLYRPRLGQAITGKTSDTSKNAKTNNALDFMNMSKRELRSSYRVQKLPNEKIRGEELFHLKLTPKADKSYKYAMLWVNKDGMPIRMKMVENNDDWTTVDLSKIEKNLKDFNANVFNLELPKGTKIV